MATDYVLGHTDQELERLQFQARCLEGVTRRMIRDCGIKAGMRVLDIGCGAGDVSLLLGEAVGPTGHVIGIDTAQRAVDLARSRVSQAAISHVEFRVGSDSDLAVMGPFDAAVGRYILVHQSDPAATVRRLAAAVKPDGVVAFLEPALYLFARNQTLEQSPLWHAVDEVLGKLFRVGMPSYDVAGRLVACFKDAGLPEPTLFWESLAFAGTNPAPARWLAATFQSLYPRMEELGLLDPMIGDPKTLSGRLQAEVGANDQIVRSAQVAAWARRL